MPWEKTSSDGNLVNFGNFDADGTNVNRWNPKNRNGNLGVSFSRRVVDKTAGFSQWFYELSDRIQPPSILPIS